MDPLLPIFLQFLIQTLIEQLLPLVMAELKKQDPDLATEVDELLIPLSSIKCAVEGIERRQEEIKTWLHLVEMVVYDANDLLDEIAYEIQRVNHIEFFPKLRGSPLNLHRKGFKRNASDRLRNIKKKLSDINDQRLTQILLMRRGWLTNNDIWNSGETSQQQTDRFLTPERVFGRSGDLQAILDLMSVKHSTLNPPANFDVISIHGMTGVGKTTLAKMVFNDERLQPAHRFHVKKWVHTPRDSDVKKLFYSIMESLTGNRCQPLDLNTIQEQLRNLLRGKKYLLVFDDMSINVNNQYYWENLKSLLSVGADGSKVLVTTRSRSIHLTLRDVVNYQLNTLLDADCRDLFNAFDGVHHPDPRLKDIVEKCRGLPMAVKNFTSISSSSGKAEGHDQWDNINSLEDNAIKQIHLEISKTIPAHIRRCFAYCSTFPPGFHFKKEMLVQLWMAQDIVSSEEAGCEIFDYMFNWSLFDCLVDFNYYRKAQQTYVMHHWIHSTALLMADGECCHVVVDQGSTISHRIRHISLVANPNNLKSVYDAKGLYSLLLISDQQNMLNLGVKLDDLVKKLPRLRSLDLSNTNIQELPDSIGDLQHLRYLALRNTRIKRLPKSVEKLYNLQTLGLANCYELTELPRALKEFQKLKYLELHLDDESRSSALSSMPPQLSKLEGLRTLSRFVASHQHHCGVSELRTLSNLRGDLCISNLDCIGDSHEAQLANLKHKTFLKVLELQWSSTTRRWRNRSAAVEASVLEQLSPHQNLKELRIKGYAGDSFPAWMASPSTFSNIVTMRLIDCKTCTQLPPLGHLPTLQHLIIKGMDRINTIDCSFCRRGETGRFPSLTKMHLENMPNLEEWISDGTCNLPQLRELIIRDCNNLKQISHALQSLTKLEILRCSELHGLRRFPSLCSLDVRESGPWIWRSLNCLPSLTSMTLTRLPMVDPIVAMQPLATVRRFEFVSCGTPEYLPYNWLPNGLTHLLIKHCTELRALPKGLHNHQTLVDLKVQDCEKLVSLGEGMRYLMSLRSIHLSNCPLLSCLSSDGLPTSLQLLSVDRCPNLSDWIQRYWSWVVQVPSVLIDGNQIK